jgi:hypothetical protein
MKPYSYKGTNYGNMNEVAKWGLSSRHGSRRHASVRARPSMDVVRRILKRRARSAARDRISDETREVEDFDYDGCDWPCSCAACVPYQWDCWATREPAPLRVSLFQLAADHAEVAAQRHERRVLKKFFARLFRQ